MEVALGIPSPIGHRPVYRSELFAGMRRQLSSCETSLVHILSMSQPRFVLLFKDITNEETNTRKNGDINNET